MHFLFVHRRTYAGDRSASRCNDRATKSRSRASPYYTTRSLCSVSALAAIPYGYRYSRSASSTSMPCSFSHGVSPSTGNVTTRIRSLSSAHR